VDGYDFGLDVDSSPISERIKRFEKSRLYFTNITI